MTLFLGKEGYRFSFLGSKLQRDRVTKIYTERRTTVRLFLYRCLDNVNASEELNIYRKKIGIKIKAPEERYIFVYKKK